MLFASSVVDPAAALAFLVAVALFEMAVVCAAWRMRRPSLLLALVVPFAPLVAAPVVVMYQYFQGTAKLAGSATGTRHPSEWLNVDSKTRAPAEPHSSWPALYWEDAMRSVRRRSLELLVEHLGPMKGSYSGPYPDRRRAFAAARAATTVLPLEATAKPIMFDGRTVVLTPRDALRLRGEALNLPATEDATALRFAILDETCLVVGFTAGPLFHAELFDTAGYGWFAHYVVDSRDLPDPI